MRAPGRNAWWVLQDIGPVSTATIRNRESDLSAREALRPPWGTLDATSGTLVASVVPHLAIRGVGAPAPNSVGPKPDRPSWRCAICHRAALLTIEYAQAAVPMSVKSAVSCFSSLFVIVTSLPSRLSPQMFQSGDDEKASSLGVKVRTAPRLRLCPRPRALARRPPSSTARSPIEQKRAAFT